MASNCPYWKSSKCVTPTGGDTGPCSYSDSDYNPGCAVFRLTAAKLAGKGTFQAMQEAGTLSPFSSYTVVGGEGGVSPATPSSPYVLSTAGPQQPRRPVAAQKSSGLAIAALTLGILGIVPFLGLLLAAIGIILGIIVIVKRKPGRGLAIGGIVVGALTFLIALSMVCGMILALTSKGASGGGTTGIAIRKVCDDPRVKEALGEPVEPVASRSDLVFTVNSDGTMERKFGFAVRGPKGTAEAHAILSKRSRSDRFSVKEIIVYCKDPHRRIEIKGSPDTPDDLIIALISIPLIVLWILAIIHGIKAARRKGVSPRWMWFGLHPLGAYIACAVIMWGIKTRICPNCKGPVDRRSGVCPACRTPVETLDVASGTRPPVISEAPPTLSAPAEPLAAVLPAGDRIPPVGEVGGATINRIASREPSGTQDQVPKEPQALVRFCKRHKTQVAIHRQPHPEATLLVCEHTFDPDVFSCGEKCVYSEGAQGGMIAALGMLGMEMVSLKPDRTVALHCLEAVGMVDHTSDAQEEPQTATSDTSSQPTETAKCDICSEQIEKPGGFCLSTSEVVLAVDYWRDGFGRHRSEYASIRTPQQAETVLTATVAQQARQASGWLVCDRCIALFDVSTESTRKFAREWWANGRKDARPGLGAVPEADALRQARKAWQEIFPHQSLEQRLAEFIGAPRNLRLVITHAEVDSLGT